ncbi:MAG: folate-binding protein [gamma proteobacterium symbiont of Taylorina sp.]|nr:folate-binding protein [gamma proteobacterium symbiont of Taylorina sp.]
MPNNWIEFLTESGASFNEQQEVSFKQSINSFSDELYLTDLSYLGLLEAKGEDSNTFLQGQLTNDISHINSSTSQLSGLCTPKGRLRALFSIHSHNEKFYLQLPKSMLEANLKRLKMFVMMSKVELTDISDELIKIGIAGTSAEKILVGFGFSIPEKSNDVSHYNNTLLIRLSGQHPRFECIGSFTQIKGLWQKIQATAQLLDTRHWKLLDIQAGIPTVQSETQESFIPQMLNLQALNGINFKKGCYTGQEIVARMQYLGKLKRRMYLAHCETSNPPLPGQELYSKTAKSGQGAGHIVDAQIALKGGTDLLAVITNDAIENNDIFLDEAMAIPLMIQELPYTFE